MSHGVLLALKRNRDSAEKAGMTERVAKLDERIALFEAELFPAPEPEAEPAPPEEPEAEAPAGVVLTPAAQARADELGVTDDDLQGQEPSGKAGEFLVSDVVRIAEAKSKSDTEGDDDGDD